MAKGTPVSEFYVTFGGKYAREAHPRLSVAHPDGWVTIEADDYEQARAATVALLGTAWCWLHDTPRDPEWFPAGELARFDATKVLTTHQ